jgi:hypothetical protein
MTHQHPTELQHRQPVAASATEVNAAPLPPQRANLHPLRFAVSLTTPQGRELLRKQFASSAEADGFAMASAELCPEYKVSSVDRIAGFAYEVMDHALKITALPNC